MKTRLAHQSRTARFFESCHRRESDHIEQPVDLPDAVEPLDDPDDSSDLDEFAPDQDDYARWDVFIPDDDEFDPEPDPSDFHGSWEPGAWSEEPE